MINRLLIVVFRIAQPNLHWTLKECLVCQREYESSEDDVCSRGILIYLFYFCDIFINNTTMLMSCSFSLNFSLNIGTNWSVL